MTDMARLWLFRTDRVGRTLCPLNDVWEFDPATTNWTWAGGSATLTCNQFQLCFVLGVYGTEGYTFPGNMPAPEFAPVGSTKSAHPWLFGGSLGTSLNDLWKFDLTTQQWTWMAGSTELYEQSGTYGSLGIADPANVPGDRNSSVGWTDNSGKLWLFGGFGAATGPPVALDDRYNSLLHE